MATGDGFVLDKVVWKFGAANTDISAAIEKGMITGATNVVIELGYTFGADKGRKREVSDSYDYSLTLTIRTDAYGANTVDKLFTSALKNPLAGANLGTGKIAWSATPASGAVSESNPKFSGVVIVDTWEPLGGSGEKSVVILQTRTFHGDGAYVKTVA